MCSRGEMRMRKKRNEKQGNGEEKLNIAFIGKIAEMVKSIADLSKVVVESTDAEKYANGIQKLNQGVSDSYEQMRLIIINSKEYTEEQKLEKLESIARLELESKQKCDEALRGNREHVANIAIEIIKGFLTCGVSFAPEIIKRLKIAQSNNADL